MKRFWLILLSLGLVMAFSASAFAVDVKFSGSFYAAGMYQDRTTFRKDSASDGPSTAFYYQRLRVRTDFVVSPGLTLTTRFDALERTWGVARSTSMTTLAKDSYGTDAENENIAFDWAYITYASPIGTFDVGIMEDGPTGTIFGNNLTSAGRIKWNNTFGPFTIKADITKVKEQSYTAKNNTVTYTDGDNDKYGIEGVFNWTGGLAGMKVIYYNYDEKSPGTSPLGNYKKNYFLFTPYAIAKIGPVDLQAELNYATGDVKKYGDGIGDISMQNITGWIDATVTFNPVYFGGTLAYVSGDDPTTAKEEGGTLDGGRDWNPCLILFNYYDRGYWVGAINGWDNTAMNGPMTNALFFQGRVGVRPIAPLDIMASVSWATVDKKPNLVLNANYGTEVDITATYKITNNLSYMLGVGYLFVGDYFKGFSNDNVIKDNYLVINKLTLTF